MCLSRIASGVFLTTPQYFNDLRSDKARRLTKSYSSFHSSNFLHCVQLLPEVCQGLEPWKATEDVLPRRSSYRQPLFDEHQL